MTHFLTIEMHLILLNCFLTKSELYYWRNCICHNIFLVYIIKNIYMIIIIFVIIYGLCFKSYGKKKNK
jgi:hypothetical protein